MSRLRCLICSLCSLLLVALAPAQTSDGKLKMAVIVSRHGVRPPLSNDTKYAQDSWPVLSQWGARCEGDLTGNGFKLATLMGGYYYDYYSQQNLLPQGCPGRQIYIWADNEERTEETAAALAKGLAHGLVGCSVKVNSLDYKVPDKDCKSDNDADYFFHPLGYFKADPDKINAFIRHLKLRLPSLKSRYRAELTALQNAVLCCKDSSVCKPLTSCSFLNLPDDFDTTKKGTFKWTGSFPVGSTDSENFLLEYANGMPCNILGWGRVAYDSTKPDCNPAGQPFRTMQRIHTLYFDLVNRHQYLATIQGSNLANQVLLKLTQGADGQAPAPLVIYAGHDSNIANIAGMLKLHWTLPDLPEDDTPPAGALVFELYEGKTPKDLYVKLKYVHATMAQMRAQTVLSVSTPPDRAGITIPDCADPCSFSQFQAIMSRAIDQSFVTQDPHPKH